MLQCKMLQCMCVWTAAEPCWNMCDAVGHQAGSSSQSAAKVQSPTQALCHSHIMQHVMSHVTMLLLLLLLLLPLHPSDRATDATVIARLPYGVTEAGKVESESTVCACIAQGLLQWPLCLCCCSNPSLGSQCFCCRDNSAT